MTSCIGGSLDLVSLVWNVAMWIGSNFGDADIDS